MIPARLLPAGLRACIAGGWAACPALAEDMDVFVFTNSPAQCVKVRGDIIIHLAEEGFEFATEQTKEPEPKKQSGVNAVGEVYPPGIFTRKVARVQLPDGKSIQVMTTDAADARAIVDTFDISTCQVAIDQDGSVVRGKDWTPVTQPPKVIVNYPSTPARLAKYNARFNFDGGPQ